MKKIEVVVLDDHSIILSVIEKELESTHVSVSNSYTNSHDLKKYLAANTPDIIIMDYALSPEDLDGLTLIKDLHKRYNKLKNISYICLFRSCHNRTNFQMWSKRFYK
ncbi:response regulator [Arsenophonus apicola]|uniref:response regulator n=1 Tax=Arsenophonus apicola TaxID=2879119 RepID=UPI003879163E